MKANLCLCLVQFYQFLIFCAGKTEDVQKTVSTNASEQIAQELKELEDDCQYQSIETGVKGMIFVRFAKKRTSPVDVVKHITKHFLESPDNIKSRYVVL